MPKARRKRMTYTEGQRRTILLAAQKDGLTAIQVQKRFGVKPITYYSWRKKRGVAARRGRRGLAMAASGGLGIQLRSAVQSRIRQVLPEIVKSEVGNYMTSLFGGRGGLRFRRADATRRAWLRTFRCARRARACGATDRGPPASRDRASRRRARATCAGSSPFRARAGCRSAHRMPSPRGYGAHCASAPSASCRR